MQGNVSVSDFTLFYESDKIKEETEGMDYWELLEYVNDYYVQSLPEMNVNVYWIFLPYKKPSGFVYFRLKELETGVGQFDFRKS